MVTPTNEPKDNSEPEPNKNQLLFASCPEIENQHQQGSNHKDSGSGRDKNLKPKKRHQDTRNQWENLDNLKLKRHKRDSAPCEICGKCFRTPTF
ncbi:hypothetical protein CHARACLAT_032790 [Characodon lateralis]|uniref:Uncharacterized protein n=1 Tax=Characodon lateralis TaxID=208331 RepID=A0ABU7D399_9TELE|nr:hypothetical protein [Characodon lateralis]